MGHHIIEFDERCKPCEGTGLYVGMAERDGAAVVCHTCNGTGCHHFKVEYDDFEKKHHRTDVKRVFEVNPGIILAANGKDIRLEDFGGVPYAYWYSGKLFPAGRENRKSTCPAWWYQSADYKRKPEWDECIGGGTFSSCNHFDTKASCWDRFDRES